MTRRSPDVPRAAAAIPRPGVASRRSRADDLAVICCASRPSRCGASASRSPRRRLLGLRLARPRRRRRTRRSVVLFHGLEGSSRLALRAGAVRASRARSAGAASYRIFAAAAVSRIGCRARYHSGDHAEVAAMLAAIRARVRASTPSIRRRRVAGRHARSLNWLGRAAAATRRDAHRRGGGVDAARPDGGRHRDRPRRSTASTRSHSCAR